VRESVTTLLFAGTDLRGLIDVLVKAVDVTKAEGGRPEIKVNERTYGSAELIKIGLLLPYDEPLRWDHQQKIDGLFVRKQHGYGRTACNLVNINQIAADTRYLAVMMREASH